MTPKAVRLGAEQTHVHAREVPAARGELRTHHEQHRRWVAPVAFATVVVAAFPLYLILGHNQWFFNDDWDFIVSRRAGSVSDLLRPHNEHWSTLPILVYRVLWYFVGARSYVPYQMLAVALHLTAGVLLWIIIRRAGVQTWIALVAGTVFVLLGSGRQNIVWAFQIGFEGSLVFGLAHLLLADHDGDLRRDDFLGLACGAAGLLCSGIAVTMVFVVGVATFLRRGWRVAAFHTVPLAGTYGVWWFFEARDAYSGPKASVALVGSYVWTGLTTAIENLSQHSHTVPALLVMLVSGLAVAWWKLPFDEWRRRAAIPVALLAGVVVFFAIAGYGRAVTLGTDQSGASRYTHLAVAMMMPAIAIAADALVRRWRVLVVVIGPLLVVGVPGNIRAVRGNGSDLGNWDVILAIAHSPLSRTVPAGGVPDRHNANLVTVGWLLRQARLGRIPDSGASPDTESAATIRLSLQQSSSRTFLSGCTPLRKPVVRTLQRGQSLYWREGLLRVEMVGPDGHVSGATTYDGTQGQRLVAALPVTVRLSSAQSHRLAQLCV